MLTLLERTLAQLDTGAHEVALQPFDQNLGFAAAMNRGIRTAGEQGFAHCLVCNNDLRIPPGGLRPLLDVLENDARVAAVGPTIVHADGTVWGRRR